MSLIKYVFGLFAALWAVSAFSQVGETLRYPTPAQPNPCVFTVAFACQGIGSGNPLPTYDLAQAATSTPLTGTFTVPGTSTVFVTQIGRAITLTLSGTWTGSIQLLRSRDGGTTKLPITYGDGTVKGLWTTNVNAIVTVETVAGATYYLSALSGFTGSAAYVVEN